MTEVWITRTRRVAASRDEVWAALTAFDRISAWAPDVTHSSFTTEATEGVGMARRVQVGRLALIETVTTWDPPSTLAYRIDGLPPVVAGVTNRWDLALDPVGTHVSLTSIVTPGRGRRLGAKAVGRVLGKASDGMLDGLIAHLGRAAPTSQDHS